MDTVLNMEMKKVKVGDDLYVCRSDLMLLLAAIGESKTSKDDLQVLIQSLGQLKSAPVVTII